MGFAGGNDVRSVFEEMKATVRGMKEDLDSWPNPSYNKHVHNTGQIQCPFPI
jgi:hypothetical protein